MKVVFFSFESVILYILITLLFILLSLSLLLLFPLLLLFYYFHFCYSIIFFFIIIIIIKAQLIPTLHVRHLIFRPAVPGRIAQSVARLTKKPEVPDSITGQSYTFVGIDHDIFTAVIFPYHRFKKGS